MNQLLQNLNLIWREREKKAISRAHKKLQDETQALKRQLLSRQPFDTIQLRKQISQLNQELLQVKRELKDANQFKEKAQREPLMGAQLIDNTLQTITNIQ